MAALRRRWLSKTRENHPVSPRNALFRGNFQRKPRQNDLKNSPETCHFLPRIEPFQALTLDFPSDALRFAAEMWPKPPPRTPPTLAPAANETVFGQNFHTITDFCFTEEFLELLWAAANYKFGMVAR